MTLAAALSILDAAPNPQASNPFTTTNPFQDFGDWMEAKEPGWKAREAARRSEQEAKRQARCKELLALYGSEEAVFEPTPLEAALRDALAPFEEPSGTLWGYRDFKFCDGPNPQMWEAIRAAVLVPDTVQGAWAAYRDQEERTRHRIAFCPDHDPNPWESAWCSALEHLLDNLRTPSAEGVAARIEWLDFLANREFSRGIEEDKALIAALRDDFAAFTASVQSGHATIADRRAAVLDLLRAGQGLSDREIARRVGVSPQTVGNIRKRQNMERTAA
ncbi:helix-turn-helix domain-containing protein [Paracoccus sp. (in: a-proteobacteria)]|uniref:helix-turn-helix domain-containing protein n=1 Tax=Paracoccus sp. TaxID=267 RepID=UPI00289E6C6F|nr:helix-turn-helix domain-containing protein [Paracoccus sp. (in: a-proteobacteria)]